MAYHFSKTALLSLLSYVAADFQKGRKIQKTELFTKRKEKGRKKELVFKANKT